VDVLTGAENERVRRLGHDALTTYGLLRGLPKKAVTGQIFQLVDQGLLERSPGQYPVLRLTDESWEVLRGQRTVWLIPTKTRKRKVKRTRVELELWDGVDRELFESLRELRRELAAERGVPPYVVFDDAALRDMARRRPTTPLEFLEVHGVGEKRLADYGEVFLARIAKHAGS
jgi:ATP-dependent DNA helicase RecQ